MSRSTSVLSSLLVFATTVFSQAVTVTPRRYTSNGYLAAQADLNGDGISDIVTTGTNGGKGGFYVTLSKPDGTYIPPVFYRSPYNAGQQVEIAVGDFNNDGKVDVAEVEGSPNYYIFLNKGDGTLLPSWNFATPSGSANYALVAGDFNHDGKLDLVMADSNANLKFLYGHGNGTFSGPFLIANNPYSNNLYVGDFDSDGLLDLAVTYPGACPRCSTHVAVYYGDGKGDFSTPSTLDFADDIDFAADNVEGNPFSDLIGVDNTSSSPKIVILHGESDRTFTEQDVALAHFGESPVSADLNGDGIRDLALFESTSGSSASLELLLGKADGTYEPEQDIYTVAYVPQGLFVGRYNDDTKPDLLTVNITDAANDGFLEFLTNATTAGSFPSCNPPNIAAGIAICSPANGGSVVSPVKVGIGADFTSPLRKTEIWIDGVKLKESFNSYSTYSFLNGSFPLGAGPHRADVYSAAYDNRLQHSTIFFNVGNASSLQYDVSLLPLSGPNYTPVGQVTVNAAGVTTVQLTKAAANTTYTIQFCPAPGNIYPNCFNVGTVSTNSAGAVSSTVSFPAGNWAGDFQLLTGSTIDFATSVYQPTPSTYYATLLPDTSVNGKGTWTQAPPAPPQAPLQSGSISMTSPGLMTIVLTGTAPNVAWIGSQCPINRGSDCYAVQTGSESPIFISNISGNAAFSAGLGTNIPEDIFYIDPFDNTLSGFVTGFRIP